MSAGVAEPVPSGQGAVTVPIPDALVSPSPASSDDTLPPDGDRLPHVEPTAAPPSPTARASPQEDASTEIDPYALLPVFDPSLPAEPWPVLPASLPRLQLPPLPPNVAVHVLITASEAEDSVRGEGSDEEEGACSVDAAAEAKRAELARSFRFGWGTWLRHLRESLAPLAASVHMREVRLSEVPLLTAASVVSPRPLRRGGRGSAAAGVGAGAVAPAASSPALSASDSPLLAPRSPPLSSQSGPAGATSTAGATSPLQHVVLQLCDGTETDGYAGVSVVDRLARSSAAAASLSATEQGLPFTGARRAFYALSTSKVAMKQRFLAAGVPTAPWVFDAAPAEGDEEDAKGPAGASSASGPSAAPTPSPSPSPSSLLGRLGALRYPVIVKPDGSYDSIGLSPRSIVASPAAALVQLRAAAREHGPCLAEEVVLGREFTVLVAGDAELGVDAWVPAERVVLPAPAAGGASAGAAPADGPSVSAASPSAATASPSSAPPGASVEAEHGIWMHHMNWESGRCAFRAPPRPWQSEVARVAAEAFLAVSGTGYGRVDLRLRVDPALGEQAARDLEAGKALPLGVLPTLYAAASTTPSTSTSTSTTSCSPAVATLASPIAVGGQLFVLEVNANCGMEAPTTTPSGAIFQLSGRPMAAFLDSALRYALCRFERDGRQLRADAQAAAEAPTAALKAAASEWAERGAPS